MPLSLAVSSTKLAHISRFMTEKCSTEKFQNPRCVQLFAKTLNLINQYVFTDFFSRLYVVCENN